jgi:serine/threonine protein kinase
LLPFLAGCARTTNLKSRIPSSPIGGGYLKDSGRSDSDLADATQGLASAPPSLGDGRYELCEFISKGGMGSVYKARDVMLDRMVAVKCLIDDGGDRGGIAAFKEARALASLSHPNILRVFDILPVGEQMWIISEWLDGQSLAQLKGSLPPPIVLAIMAQVYDALAAAHAAQVIHRDIKPSNVMIGWDGRVTLIDFGVAVGPGAPSGESIAGSLRYTDPRTLEGETPDALSDLFSAALLQIELMIGEPVLPHLAPLPLFRYMKKSLPRRLDDLLDGTYPPLENVARRLTAHFRAAGEGSSSPSTAREAALLTHDALRRLTLKTPQQYLVDGFCRGILTDPAADSAIAEEIDTNLQSHLLTPRQKAAWVAFKSTMEVEGILAEAGFRTPQHAQRQDPAAPGEPLLRWQWLVSGFGAIVLVAGLWAARWYQGTPPIDAQRSSAIARQDDEQAPRPLPIAASDEPIRQLPEPLSSQPVNRARPQVPKAVPVYLVADVWATVSIDGTVLGDLPRAAAFMLSPGSHSLILKNPALKPLAITLKVPSKGSVRRHFTLQKQRR